MHPTCAHCGQEAIGYDVSNQHRLCNGDLRQCYRLVTDHQHKTPCSLDTCRGQFIRYNT